MSSLFHLVIITQSLYSFPLWVCLKNLCGDEGESQILSRRCRGITGDAHLYVYVELFNISALSILLLPSVHSVASFTNLKKLLKSMFLLTSPLKPPPVNEDTPVLKFHLHEGSAFPLQTSQWSFITRVNLHLVNVTCVASHYLWRKWPPSLKLWKSAAKPQKMWQTSMKFQLFSWILRFLKKSVW